MSSAGQHASSPALSGQLSSLERRCWIFQAFRPKCFHSQQVLGLRTICVIYTLGTEGNKRFVGTGVNPQQKVPADSWAKRKFYPPNISRKSSKTYT
ncbi:hypothetical protein PoB_003944000 [Plakobranchus ocellatus]|uniref:Uncharacterized protein n=1 Tax=Plakobranchus ocellatus TaxID=259542 RepID=A0AAV4B078_9GAST|nr:hypothetical protein PoB_003944000 [Plakobranchus ocellatus]